MRFGSSGISNNVLLHLRFYYLKCLTLQVAKALVQTYPATGRSRRYIDLVQCLLETRQQQKQSMAFSILYILEVSLGGEPDTCKVNSTTHCKV